MSSDWTDAMDRYSISHPFGDFLKTIEINEDDVDEELLETCIETFVVAEVVKGYYITHEDIEEHLEVINEHGMEAYLQKRLELVSDE